MIVKGIFPKARLPEAFVGLSTGAKRFFEIGYSFWGERPDPMTPIRPA